MISEEGISCENARFDTRFAKLNYIQGYYRQAASLYMRVYKDNSECALDNRIYGDIPGSLNNAGSAYLQINMLDSAMLCFKEALNFIEKK
ncbi:hypothetical protein [Pedobacter sp.]|uniref:hypothetical protein n=1 Tax=Pedobacter sp. TaxID=1411316 RepID=UPI003BA96090